MPTDTMKQWMDLLSAIVPRKEVSSILDLGAGTGRFSCSLATRYQCPVLAVDPSESMLLKGRYSQEAQKNITWRVGTAEKIPSQDGSIDLVWMSQAFHHIDDDSKALQEIKRVLVEAGFLAIRNGMRDHIDGIILYDCFPEAAKIERDRLMLQKEMIDLVSQHGFGLRTTIRHYQYFASSYHEYAEKISNRGLSALIAISDDAFEKGLERLQNWVKGRPAIEPVYEPVDLLVFQKQCA